MGAFHPELALRVDPCFDSPITSPHALPHHFTKLLHLPPLLFHISKLLPQLRNFVFIINKYAKKSIPYQVFP